MSLIMQLEAIDGLTIYGPRPERGRTALCSFNVEGVHPTDISTLLDMNGKLSQLCKTDTNSFAHQLGRGQVSTCYSEGQTLIWCQKQFMLLWEEVG